MSVRSGENHAIMKKTFWYLLFMVIVFPTFGFTSTKAYLEFLFTTSNTTNSELNWECIFLPDSGAFFVNYVITAALIGSGLELIRFPELFWYLIQICLSRSKVETTAIRKAIRWKQKYGDSYGATIYVVGMSSSLGSSTPG